MVIVVRQGSTTFGTKFIIPYNCRSCHARRSHSTYCKKTIHVVAWNVHLILREISAFLFLFFIVRGSQTDLEGKFQPCYPSMLSLILEIRINKTYLGPYLVPPNKELVNMNSQYPANKINKYMK